MLTFSEALSQALLEAWAPPVDLKEPNIMMSVEVDPDHFEESKKTKGIFSKAHKVENIKGLGVVRSTILITKEYSDEVIDMVKRGTITIKAMQVSDDLHYEDGANDSSNYQKFSYIKNKTAVINILEYLRKNNIRK